MKHIMLDLETLGVRPGSSILSIGAVTFTAEGVVPEEDFSIVVSRASCRDAGLVEDPDTVAWWDRQDPEAWAVVERASTADAEPIARAIHHFWVWFTEVGPIDGGVWSLGADFDLPILSEAYRRIGWKAPWKYNAGRCFRTLRALRPDVVAPPFVGVRHDALADAKNQATHAALILTAIVKGAAS